MDAIDLLKHDHRMVEQLFRDHRSAATPAQRKAVLEILVRELSKHAAVEELLFYPFAGRAVGREEEIKRHLQEHMTIKRLLAELDSARGDGERAGPVLAALREAVAEHIREEEEQLMPEVRAAADEDELRELGAELERAKRRAPTRPHPSAPDRPPALAMAAPVAAAYDRLRDRLQSRPRT
ncbi:hemerythrin domain-containing protein [Actinomadura violacea]|uniref:Hemerythrin domain-containing protein n=1 Tax=Actinomadura violacea TaxID=2819934 RepID=A0ABS3RM47_9ACTN|nr:hemerythrin domain-containing protein [Actinomadura violacea]MBO2457686.1 hemerythrin domain-containing protein [Actinomadura violacea]